MSRHRGLKDMIGEAIDMQDYEDQEDEEYQEEQDEQYCM